MASPFTGLVCDGCGRPASAGHIAQRLLRLERATKFRPIHIAALFIARAPLPRPEDDFYGPPESKEFFNAFLDGLGIAADPGQSHAGQGPDAAAIASARLLDFQRKGFYLAYLSECPIVGTEEPAGTTIPRLAQTLVRRIRLNYKPKEVVVLGKELAALIEVLRSSDIGSTSTLDQSTALSAQGYDRIKAII